MFKSRAEKLGRVVPDLLAEARDAQRVVADAKDDALLDRLPRGVDVVRQTIHRKESARWARPDEIAAYVYSPGGVLLGKYRDQLIGSRDDKPLVTIASARSGKTATVLKPTLLTYPGSAVVLDPKGELAMATARHRQNTLGQKVCILDPFGCTGLPPASFNALAELDPDAASIVDDVDAITQALILDEHSGSEGSHWTNSAQALLRGLILYALTLAEAERNLVTVRQLLMLNWPPLQKLAAALEGKGDIDVYEAIQKALFTDMAKARPRFGGALAGSGASFLRKLAKGPREVAGIISTAETQTRFLDSVPLQRVSLRSDFRLGELAWRPMTLYLCLPASSMETHFRYLRLVVRLALMALEKRGGWPRGKTPILFMMEEFPTLGHMPIMEQAAAYFPGFGVRLWAVLQDLGQLQRHYRQAWQTFLGNAGVLQFFGNGDKVTLDYMSDMLGSLSFVRERFTSTHAPGADAKEYIDKERLLYPHEASHAFARETAAQMLLMHGKPPMAIARLSFADVEALVKGGVAPRA